MPHKQVSSAQERFRTTRQVLNICAEGARRAQEDAQTRKGGRKLVRLPDYSLIAGFITPAGARGRGIGANPITDIDIMGRSIFAVYDELEPSQAGLDFALAFPTLCELAMSLQRHADRLGEAASRLQKDSAIYSKLMRALDLGDPWEASSGDLTTDVKNVLDLLPAAVQGTGLRRFRDMVKSKRIKGLGDVFTKSDYDKVKGEIAYTARGLATLLMKYRKRREREDQDGFELRNRIDALNFALANSMRRVRSDTDLSLVAPLSPSVRGEQFQQVLSNRTLPQTIFLALKAAQLYKDQHDVRKGSERLVEGLPRRGRDGPPLHERRHRLHPHAHGRMRRGQRVLLPVWQAP